MVRENLLELGCYMTVSVWSPYLGFQRVGRRRSVRTGFLHQAQRVSGGITVRTVTYKGAEVSISTLNTVSHSSRWSDFM